MKANELEEIALLVTQLGAALTKLVSEESSPSNKPKTKRKAKSKSSKDQRPKYKGCEYVYLWSNEVDSLINDLGKDKFHSCVDKLELWIASAAPLPNEPESPNFIQRKQQGFNIAGHLFRRGWVGRSVDEDQAKSNLQPTNVNELLREQWKSQEESF